MDKLKRVKKGISRRHFLSSGLSIVGGAAISSVYGFPKLDLFEEPLKVGIIGTGDRGQGLASLIRDIPSIQLSACCDTLPFRLQKGMEYGDKSTKAYKDYRALLEDKSLDAIIIATPFGTHAQIAMDAMEANKHIYCEKTLSYGYEPTKKLVERSRGYQKVFQTGHQYHSSRLYLHVHDLIKKGYIGEVAHIECQWNRNGDWRREVPDPKWERHINWRMYREMSGGLTAELCSHQIDFTNWITGSHPIKVTGFGGIDHWKDGRETYDNVHLLTEYPGGLKASYTCLTTNAKDGYQITVRGSEGTIVLDYVKAWIYAEPSKVADLGIVDGVSGATKKTWEKGDGRPLEVVHKNPTLQALLDFQTSIRKNKQPLSNLETGAKAAIVVQMGLDAMDNNSVEYWKPEYNF